MKTVAEVRLWGTTVGAVSLDPGQTTASFEYNPDFLPSNIEVAPLTMPLSRNIYRFPSLNLQTFHGLPGLLADSLPDTFGNALIDAWLASQGREPSTFNAIERLCYTGQRGMGALEFYPVTGPSAEKGDVIEVKELVELASKILSSRGKIKGNFKGKKRSEALERILNVGTSAGGARAKAVIAWNPTTGEVRSGQLDAPDGYEHWILKFDGVEDNKDKELNDPKGYGAIEYAYSLMAKDIGIEMAECRLLEENGRRHFMTRRFDRRNKGEKVHMQTLGSIAHLDYNMAGTSSYEQAFYVVRKLGLATDTVEKLFQRAIFNIVARNQDDHVKNIAFLMNKKGQWSLAPAYDLNYAYQPQGLWTARHQMSLNGKRENFELEDIEAAGKKAGLKNGKAKSLLSDVVKLVKNWDDYAHEAKVSKQHKQLVKSNLRLKWRGI